MFAALHGPLVRGYALDALTTPTPDVPPVAAVQAWLDAVLASTPVRRPTPGAGEALHFATPVAQGSGLAHRGELLQLCAFPGERREAHAIGRPSRRG